MGGWSAVGGPCHRPIIPKDSYLPAFISLLDNYESDTGEPEVVTPEEIAENHRFLDAVMDTAVMKVW